MAPEPLDAVVIADRHVDGHRAESDNALVARKVDRTDPATGAIDGVVVVPWCGPRPLAEYEECPVGCREGPAGAEGPDELRERHRGVVERAVASSVREELVVPELLLL